MAESHNPEDKTEKQAHKEDNDTVTSAEDVELEPVEVEDLGEYEVHQAEEAVALAQDEYGAADTNPDVVGVRSRIEQVKNTKETAEKETRHSDKEDK